MERKWHVYEWISLHRQTRNASLDIICMENSGVYRGSWWYVYFNNPGNIYQHEVNKLVVKELRRCELKSIFHRESNKWDYWSGWLVGCLTSEYSIRKLLCHNRLDNCYACTIVQQSNSLSSIIGNSLIRGFVNPENCLWNCNCRYGNSYSVIFLIAVGLSSLIIFHLINYILSVSSVYP